MIARAEKSLYRFCAFPLRMQSAPPRRFSVVIARLCILLFAFLLPLVAAEVYFRVRYAPTATLDGWHVPDPWIGWDTSPPVIPLANEHRSRTVFFLGDSFVDGKEWPHLAQQIAKGRGSAFDGFALGVSGQGTTQQFLKLQRYIDQYEPDAIILLFFAWNDLRDNVRTPSLFYSPALLARPYYVARDGGFILWHQPASFLRRLLARSEVYVRVIERMILQRNAALARRDIHSIAASERPVRLYYDEPAAWTPFYKASEQEQPYVRLAYRTTEYVLTQMKEFLDRRGIPLLVIGIDNAFTVDRDVFERVVMDPEHFDSALPLARMEAMFRKLGISFINALPAFRREREHIGRKIYNGPEGNVGAHLEPEGERVLAEIAADAIVRMLERR